MIVKDTDFFITALENGVKRRVEAIAAEETAKAQMEISRRVRSEIDRIALDLCLEYSIERIGTDLRITVSKPAEDR